MHAEIFFYMLLNAFRLEVKAFPLPVRRCGETPHFENLAATECYVLKSYIPSSLILAGGSLV
jgi:hypothetical protein